MTANTYIERTPGGWRVHVTRKNFRYTANFTDLARARADRDRLLKEIGWWPARSNTGVRGISELPWWRGGRMRMAFSVTYRHPRQVPLRRFYYDTSRQRDAALRAAIAWRARVAGEDSAQLLNQAREALAL